jgi:hypothetical protein
LRDWWDTHSDNFWSLKNGFLPPFDTASSALIEDLDKRGLLNTTMVVAWGEHGRAPPLMQTLAGITGCPRFSAGDCPWYPALKGVRRLAQPMPMRPYPKDNPKYPQDVLSDDLSAFADRCYRQLSRPHRTPPSGFAVRHADRRIVAGMNDVFCICSNGEDP